VDSNKKFDKERRMVNFMLGHERGTRTKSESLMEIKSMTFRTPVSSQMHKLLSYWETRPFGFKCSKGFLEVTEINSNRNFDKEKGC